MMVHSNIMHFETLLSLYFAVQFLDGFFEFNLASLVWKDLSNIVMGQQPSARCGCGFTSAGSKLFVFGGQDDPTGVSGL